MLQFEGYSNVMRTTLETSVLLCALMCISSVNIIYIYVYFVICLCIVYKFFYVHVL